jgi:hypothetical protein
MDELEKEYSQNRVEMKKIKKKTTIISIVYGLYLLMILFLIFYAVMISPKFLIAALFVIAGAVTGFMGLYKHNEHLSKASLIIIIVQYLSLTIINSKDISDIFTSLLFTLPGYAVIIFYAVTAIKCVKKYNWLEQQDGFPNFEPQLAMYDIEKHQRNIKDPFAIKKEQIEQRTQNAGHMDEL